MKLLFLSFVVTILYSTAYPDGFVIDNFCTNKERPAPSSIDVITAPEGDKLVAVDIYYDVRPKELLLRRGFSDVEYCIYKGEITPEAAAGNLDLNKFKFPEGMNMTIALRTKFYNSKNADQGNDLKNVFFDDFGIYVDLTLKIYYNLDGNWYELVGEKSTWLRDSPQIEKKPAVDNFIKTEITQEIPPPKHPVNIFKGIGIGMSYVNTGFRCSVNMHPDTIFKANSTDSFAIVNNSGLSIPSRLNGFNFALIIGGNILSWKLMFEGAYSDVFSSNSGGTEFLFGIPIVNEKIYLPVGVGYTGGSLQYKWNAAPNYESMSRKIALDKTTTDGFVKTFCNFITCSGGINYKLKGRIISLDVGYQFNIHNTTSKITYKTGEKDSNGDAKEKDLEVSERYLPYNNAALSNVKIRLGFYFLL